MKDTNTRYKIQDRRFFIDVYKLKRVYNNLNKIISYSEYNDIENDRYEISGKLIDVYLHIHLDVKKIMCCFLRKTKIAKRLRLKKRNNFWKNS